jgi:prepilin-type N-terminal cleavage/methylation domain-containing protein
MRDQRGFTLIELLIVIAIIAVLSAAVFVALNPAQRFAESRNAKRWADVEAIVTAAKVDQVDNGGGYATSISGITSGQGRIVGTAGAGCSANCPAGTALYTLNAACVNINTDLVAEGYLSSAPISPTASGGTTWDAAITGYFIGRNADGTLTVGACAPELSASIVVER